MQSNITSLTLKKYFDTYGNVIELVKMKDTTNISSYSFITFDDENSIDLIMNNKKHTINGIEIKVERVLMNESSQNVISCPLCLDSLNEIKKEKKIVSSTCGHMLCSVCLETLFKNSNKNNCMFCGKTLTISDYFHIFFL